MAPTVRSSRNGPSLKYLLAAALLLICSSVSINGGLYEARQSPALSALTLFLSGEPGTDSWMPMRAAAEWLSEDLPGTVYQELFFDQNIKFQYPPSSLLLFSGSRAIGIEPSNALLNGISWFAVLVTAAAVAWQMRILLTKTATVAHPSGILVLASALAAFATLTFYPILKSYGLGQAQTWINAAFALTVVCWILEQRFLAGLLMGLVCMIKPQFALFVVWGLLRRQMSFVAGMMTIGIPVTAIAIALYGFANHIDYLSVIQFLTRHGESYFANQSINGLLHRLHTGGFLEWHQGVFPTYVSSIHYATILASVAILSVALFCKPKNESDSLLDFFTAALSFTLASPVAWDHHYGILPPIFLTLLFTLASMPNSRSRMSLSIAGGVAFMFAANLFPFTFGCDGPGSLVQSYLLMAALAVLGVLYQLRWNKAKSAI